MLRAQLRRLTEVAAMPQVTLQVVSFARGSHAGASGSFTILRFAEQDLPDVIYAEQLTSALYPEQHPDVEHYLEGHGPAQRRGTDARRHDWLYQAGCQRDMKGTGE